MLELQLKQFGSLLRKSKLSLIGLSILNILMISLENGDLSEKVISTLLSILYIVVALRMGNHPKASLVFLVIVHLLFNSFLLSVDVSYFIQQCVGTVVELFVIIYFIKKINAIELSIVSLEKI